MHLTIYVSSFHPTQTLPNPANPTFFLSILCHENYHGSLLEAAVGERHFDEDWMADQAPVYIANVTLLEIEDYPPQSEEYGVQPGAVYCLTVFHPDWIAHLKRGALWETTAYQISPSRRVTSNGKPWQALFDDLMNSWHGKNWKKFRVNDEVLQHLIDALDCEDEAIVTEATQWLERIEGANASVPRLLRALDDRNHTVRDASLYALGAIKDSRAVPSLLCSLRYCDKEERWGCQVENISALLALAHLGPRLHWLWRQWSFCLFSCWVGSSYQISNQGIYKQN